MPNNISVDLEIKDQYTAELNQFKQKTAGIVNTVKRKFSELKNVIPANLRSMLVTLGTTYLSWNLIISKGIKNAIDSAQANITLAASLKRVHDSMDLTKAQDYFLGLQTMLKVDDDALKKHAVELQTATGMSMQAILALMPGIIGFSRQGQSIDTVIRQLISGMSGATRGLKQLGIEVNASAGKEQIYEAIRLKMVAMGVVAEDFAKSKLGQIEAATVTLNDVVQNFGDGFLEAFSVNTQAAEGMGLTLKSLGKAFAGLIKWVSVLANGFMTGFALIKGVAVGTFQAIGIYAGTMYSYLEQSWSLIVNQVKGGAKVIAGGVRIAFNTAIEWVLKLVNKALEGYNYVMKIFNGNQVKLINTDQTKKDVQEALKQVGEGTALMAGSIQKQWDITLESGKLMVDTIKQDVGDTLSTALLNATKYGDAMRSTLGMETVLGPEAGAGTAPSTDKPDQIFATVKNDMDEAKKDSTDIKDNLSAAASSARSLMQSIQDQVKNRLNDIRTAREATATQGTKKRVERIDEDINRAKGRGDYDEVNRLQQRRDSALGMDKYTEAGQRYLQQKARQVGGGTGESSEAGGKGNGKGGGPVEAITDSMDSVSGSFAALAKALINKLNDLRGDIDGLSGKVEALA